LININRKLLFFFSEVFIFFTVGLLASDEVYRGDLSFITEQYLLEKTEKLLKQPTFLDCMEEVCPDFSYQPILSDKGRPEDSDRGINRAIIGAQQKFPQNIFSYDETISILENSKKLPFAFPPKEYSLPIISVPYLEDAEIFYLSDMHGNKSVAPFLKFIHAKKERVAIFGGDWFDRGLGIDNFLLALTYANHYKKEGLKKIFFLNGDHEEKEYHYQKGTNEEIERRFPDEGQRNTFREKFYELLEYFPVAGYMNRIFFSHALVHADQNSEWIEVDGQLREFPGAGQDNEHNTDVINCLFSPNGKIKKEDDENIIEISLKKNDSDVFYEYIELNSSDLSRETLIDTPLYKCHFSNKRWRDDKDFLFFRQWVNKYDPDGYKIQIFFNGHDHPQESTDRKFEYIEKCGCYIRSLVNGKFINSKDKILEYPVNATCGAGGSNSYGISRFYFPFSSNNVTFGLSRHYAIYYKNEKIRTLLLEEDKDSEYFALKQFWKLFENYHLKDRENFSTMECYIASFLNTEENKNMLLKILDDSFQSNTWSNFLYENKNFFDKDEFDHIRSNPKEYLKDQKYSKKETEIQINTNFFLKHSKLIFWLSEQIKNKGKSEHILNRLLKLKNEFESEKDTFLEKCDNRRSLDLKFAANLTSFFYSHFYDPIHQIVTNLKSQFDLKKAFSTQKELWNNFCNQNFQQQLPLSLSFIDGFATYSKGEIKCLFRLLCHKKFQQFVNQGNHHNDSNKKYIDTLITNAFAAQDLSSLYYGDATLAWMTKEGKQHVVNCLIDFLRENDYLSTNSKCVILSNIALFLDEGQEFPLDFKVIQNVLEEQLIQLCDVGFAIEKPITSFKQIFAALSLDQSTDLLKHLLLVPIKNKKQQSKICMESAIGATSCLVKIEEILPILLTYSDLERDLKVFEEFCINGFRNNSDAFLDFFYHFLVDDQLHSCFKQLIKFSFILDILRKNPKKLIEDALKRIEESKKFESRKTGILNSLKSIVYCNVFLVDFFIKHASPQELSSMFKKFYKHIFEERKEIENQLNVLKIQNNNLSSDDIATSPDDFNLSEKTRIMESIRKKNNFIDNDIKILILSGYNAIKEYKPAYLDIVFNLLCDEKYSNFLFDQNDICMTYVKFLIAAAQERLQAIEGVTVYFSYIENMFIAEEYLYNNVREMLNKINDTFVIDFVVMSLQAYHHLFEQYKDLLNSVAVENFIRFATIASDSSIDHYYQKNEDETINFFWKNEENQDDNEKYHRADDVEKFILRLLIAKEDSLRQVLIKFLSYDQIKKIVNIASLLKSFEAHFETLFQSDRILFLQRIIDCFEDNETMQGFVKKRIQIWTTKNGENFDLLDVSSIKKVLEMLKEKININNVGDVVIEQVLNSQNEDNFIEKLCEIPVDLRCMVLEKLLSADSGPYDIKINKLMENLLEKIAGISATCDPEPIREIINFLQHYSNTKSPNNRFFSLLFDKLSKQPTFFSDDFFPIQSWRNDKKRKLILSDKNLFLVLCGVFHNKRIELFSLYNANANLFQSILSCDEFIRFILNGNGFNIEQTISLAAIFFALGFDDYQTPFEDDFIIKIVQQLGGLAIKEIFIPKKEYTNQNNALLCKFGVENGRRICDFHDTILDFLLENNDFDNSLQVARSLLMLPRATIALERYVSGDEYHTLFNKIADTVILRVQKLSPSSKELFLKYLFPSFCTTVQMRKIGSADELSLIAHDFFFRIAQAVVPHCDPVYVQKLLPHGSQYINPLMFFADIDKKTELLQQYLKAPYPNNSKLYIVNMLLKYCVLGDTEKELCSNYIDNYKQNIEKINYNKDLRNNLLFLALGGLFAVAAILWFKPYKHQLVTQIKNYAFWRLGFSSG